VRKSSFPPIVRRGTRVLILGSLPGEASLAAARYYAHPQNQFWQLAGAVIGREIAGLSYEARLEALTDAGVGVWDTVGSARRAGSLDGAIRDIAANDLRALTASLPELRAVGFNGGTAARIGRSALAGSTLALVDLPSSSPAYCRVTLAEKSERWIALREFLA
jgi:hypoxanthine-DNA glycosylase